MNDSLLRRLREASAGVFRQAPVVFGYLFGSQAGGRSHPESDVDVAVYLDATAPPDRYLDISLHLAGALSETSAVGNVEVVVMNRAPLPLLGRIIQGRSVLYSRDEPARVRFESRTLREFFDYEIHARPLDEKFLRDMTEGRR